MTQYLITQVASSTPFNNSTNGFVSTNVQDAIEESLTVAIAKPRYAIVTVHNGTISNNQWLGYSNLLPGNTVRIAIAIASILREITFAFAGSGVDGKFNLYKNGTSAGNIVYTVQFTGQNSPLIVSGINISLAAGDTITGRWVDEGQNPNDMAITYFPQVQ